MAVRYRARRPRASPLWQCLHACIEDFLNPGSSHISNTTSPLRPEALDHFRAFLRCGDLAHGFIRIACGECRHEYLLPFTCKRRGVCPSCHQRRSVETAQFLAHEIFQPLPHRHIVLTVPRALRWLFRQHREHLQLLCSAAREALTHWLQHRTAQPAGEIAAVAALHTFGDYLVFHPHLHVLAACGVFDADGVFHLAPPGGAAGLSDLFRLALLRRVVDHRLLSARQAHRFLSWRHSGFHVDTGEAPVAADDPAARQRLAEYLLRAPFSLEKMHWNPATRTVLYRSARSWRTKRNFEVFSGPAFIAALAEHIPLKHAQMIRYYGRYSNKRRARLARAAGDALAAPSVRPFSRPAPRRRQPWRQLLIRVWGADPLRCPCCGALMHKQKVVEEPAEIHQTLAALGLWEGLIALPPPHAPPVPRSTAALWAVDAADGRCVDLEPAFTLGPLPTDPRLRPPRERYLSRTPDDDTVTPTTEYNQPDETWAPEIRQRDDGLLLLYDGDVEPPNDEPVFWTD